MNKNIKKISLIGILPLLIIYSCKPPEEQETVDESTFGAAQVKVFRVVRQRISEKLFYTGLIEARKRIVINPDIGGKIARIYVEEGDRVTKDQVLAELDNRAIRLQLKQAQAALAVAEASSNDAERNMERMERLKKENAVSDQQYEKIKLALESTEAQLQQAKAAVNLAEYNLDVSIMEAPFNGIIAAINAEEGDVINPMMGGFSPSSGVLTLMDFSVVKIEIEVSQNDIIRIQKGQSALIMLSAYPDKVFKGSVRVVNQAADPLSRKFRVEIQANNPDLALKPNTFGEVTLEVSTRDDALVVPQRALIEGRYIFLAEGNKAIKREVNLGLQNSDYLEVIQGLNEGDLVVIEGNYGLEDGAEIEVEEAIQ